MTKGTGNFQYKTKNGVNEFIYYSDEEILNLKTNAAGVYGTFLLGVSYEIKEGVLYISGMLHKTEVININIGDSYYNIDTHSEEDLPMLKQLYHIPEAEILVKERKNWLGRVVGTYIEVYKAYCLPIAGRPFTVKTSNFKILEYKLITNEIDTRQIL
jgi:hypothetical protein